MKTIIPFKNCIHCKCILNANNRAQWPDHCNECEYKVFQFYGAISDIVDIEIKEE